MWNNITVDSDYSEPVVIVNHLGVDCIKTRSTVCSTVRLVVVLVNALLL